MSKSVVIRSCAFSAILGSAVCAHAVGISLISGGHAQNVGSNVTVTEAVLLQQGGFGPLANLTYTISNDSALAGSGVYTGTGGSLQFSVAFSGLLTNNGSQSIDGTWTATGGTGTYAGDTGSGTVTLNVLNNLNQDSGTVFSGNLEAVPEPPSVAALAIGAVCLLRRRRA